MGYGQGHIGGDIMLLLGLAGVGHVVLAQCALVCF